MALTVTLTVGIIHIVKYTGDVTVTFESNGGGEFEPFTVKKGTVLDREALPKPYKAGNYFDGWCLDESLSDYYVDMPVTSNITLYAAYSPKEVLSSDGAVEVAIMDLDKDTVFPVRSEVALTNENISDFVTISVEKSYYDDGEGNQIEADNAYFTEDLALKVEDKGNGIYHVSGNYNKPITYILDIVSDRVTFCTDGTSLAEYGVRSATRTVVFSIDAEDYTNDEFCDGDIVIPDEYVYSHGEDGLLLYQNDLGLEIGDIVAVMKSGDIGYYVIGQSFEHSVSKIAADGQVADVTLECYAVERAKLANVYKSFDS